MILSILSWAIKMKRLLGIFIKIFSKLIATLYFSYESFLHMLSTHQARLLRQNIVFKFDNEIRKVRHSFNGSDISLKIHTPNMLCLSRYNSFSSKEPEMLEWIEEFGGEGTFYDIGACIGLYSLYYAKLHKGDVVSFEPSVFNLKQLAKNISINNFSNKISIVPNPLSDTTGSAIFKNGSTDEGGALSAFGVDFGSDGKYFAGDIQYGLLGFSLDDLLNMQILSSPPALLKIDVDGIEHYILKGAEETLKLECLRTVYIEVNAGFAEQADKIEKILITSGFTLRERKKKGQAVDDSFERSHNQIWVKY